MPLDQHSNKGVLKLGTTTPLLRGQFSYQRILSSNKRLVNAAFRRTLYMFNDIRPAPICMPDKTLQCTRTYFLCMNAAVLEVLVPGVSILLYGLGILDASQGTGMYTTSCSSQQ